MNKRILLLSVLVIVITTIIGANYFSHTTKPLPIIAIANYGPHASLEASIRGLKQQLAEEGFIEHETIEYRIADVNFDPALIPQLIATLKQHHPKVLVVMGTPIAQFTKGQISDIPLVYNAVTNPVEAGLLKTPNKPEMNMTGSSDMQDLKAFLKFTKTILPNAKKVGLLYATSESNDIALVNMMRTAALAYDMEVVAIPVEQARDVFVRVQEFKNQVDLIYVGTSGPIQPTLPTISAEARKMGIPVFNIEAQAVQDGLAVASFGVNYEAVGRNTGKLVSALLNGHPVHDLAPIYPALSDHHGLINKKEAMELGITIPPHIETVE